MKELYSCTVLLPLYCTFSMTSSPPPPLPNVQYLLTVCDCGEEAGGVWKGTVDHILQEFYTLFLTRFRTYKIASPPQTKMTSKDDIKGLVSLKFLRPWGWSNTEARLAGSRILTRRMWFCTWLTGRTVCLFRTVPVALTGAAKLRADGISSCFYIANVHNHPSWAMSHKEDMAWYSSIDPCLLSGPIKESVGGLQSRFQF